MKVEDEILNAIKTKNIILGYRESIKYIKAKDVNLVVIAKNAPEKIKREIKHNTKISKARLEEFMGTSKELGVLCGKPYPVSVLVIK